MFADGLEDPACEAEVRLLRDDCRYLKVGGWVRANWQAGCSVLHQQAVISNSDSGSTATVTVSPLAL
jgi:hypothetical protein